MLGFMIGVANGLYEPRIGSSILTRRGGTDANGPQSPREAIDPLVGILGPRILEISGRCPTNNFPKKYRKVVPDMSNSKEMG